MIGKSYRCGSVWYSLVGDYDGIVFECIGHFDGEIGCDKQVIYDAFKDAELYRKLPFYDGAKKALSLLVERVDTVYGYTASVDSETIFNERKELVEKLGLIPKVFVDKKPVMDADALFDDCIGVHRCWVAANSKAKLYLINQNHNQVTDENRNDPIWDSVIRCDSLLEAVEMFLEDKKKTE